MTNLEKIAREIRILTVKCIASLGSGHIGGSMSIVDVLTALYYKEMNVDPKNPLMEGRDRLVVSKGHAGPAVYATLAHKGYFPESELYTLNKYGTNLPSHCDMNKTPGVDMTTGSLGQGISCALGLALGSKIKNDNATIYAIIGDGESQEGQVWEAAMTSSHYKLDNLCVIVDNNNLQIDGEVKDVMSPYPIDEKFEKFGFHTINIDGHNFEEIVNAFEQAKLIKEKPTVIIAKTIKGKGVSYMENQAGWHGVAPNDEQCAIALEELKGE